MEQGGQDVVIIDNELERAVNTSNETNSALFCSFRQLVQKISQ